RCAQISVALPQLAVRIRYRADFAGDRRGDTGERTNVKWDEELIYCEVRGIAEEVTASAET
ncbi:MAG: hypothetical protein ACI8P2_004479, partial [Candidatus Latescibacterota bacterium]